MSSQPQGQDLFDKLASEGPVDAGKLLDEDEILTEDDKKKPERTEADTGGEKKPKKACANCNCGSAEDLGKKPEESSKSSCRSCYLGAHLAHPEVCLPSNHARR